MKTDEICEEYSTNDIKINIMDVDDMIIIEGTSDTLKFLGNLLLAHANGNFDDCGFSISPTGAGSIFFDNNSVKGLYIHRIPCKHERMHLNE
jgi:hypothetical protein